MSSKLFWMRHGTCRDGRDKPHAHPQPESPLTPDGAVEVRDRAQSLDLPTARPLVVSSPLLRARQTARIVAHSLGADLAPPVEVFAEWRAPDCVLGLTPAHYPTSYDHWRRIRARHPETSLSGGESLGTFADRAAQAATAAQNLSDCYRAVVIVSHRLLIGAVAALNGGHRDPGEIFAFASDFALPPATTWTPS